MRSHYCGEVNSSHIDQTVEFSGWVNRRRDHGGVIFIDLRDREGLVQVVYDPDLPDVFSIAEQVRNEYVLRVKGRVRPRPEGSVNPDLASGEIEVLGLELEVLNRSDTPPFQLDEHEHVSEEVRLRHRYVDLRRPEMQERLRRFVAREERDSRNRGDEDRARDRETLFDERRCALVEHVRRDLVLEAGHALVEITVLPVLLECGVLSAFGPRTHDQPGIAVLEALVLVIRRETGRGRTGTRQAGR